MVSLHVYELKFLAMSFLDAPEIIWTSYSLNHTTDCVRHGKLMGVRCLKIAKSGENPALSRNGDVPLGKSPVAYS